MATWTDIPTEVLEPGKPIRSVDALALRDNPIAMAEGAAGAPRIVAEALAPNSVTTEKIVNGNVTNAKIASLEAGKITGLTNGAVGTYALVIASSQADRNYLWGQAVSGSNLSPAYFGINAASNLDLGPVWNPSPPPGGLPGTWRIMGSRTAKGNQGNPPRYLTLAVRIS